ncbi:hypothetical protein I5907_20015 [Panacibacter sp. DH6]|uniref:Reverse transcriptase domain-containing protein n=1 Tax=Panacibacter microcysteis TaxID=2793269 RepID=A0A931MDD8_9BACT|nr:reverse transcriptase domain-containing protein [Panacibacter microcysteis]MBG9378532.1 hypothetical protein [Panacibacter microcysteis]
MKTFDQHFSEDAIIRQICKVRVKLAKSKSKRHLLHLLTSNEKYNYHTQSNIPPSNEFEKCQLELTRFLATILPPRKKWLKLGEVSRLNFKAIAAIKKGEENNEKINKRNYSLTSNDKNFYSLLKTINVYKKRKSQEQWLVNLKNFVNEIKALSVTKTYQVTKPLIFPKLKEKKKNIGINECRPICMFNLRDRIILSTTNKFLTQLFDEHFQDSSYAFRAKRNEENQILSHHDCIKDILKYRNKVNSNGLYAVECDMKKFYDTVNHNIARSLFHELISLSVSLHPELTLDAPIRIFESYLSCFAFNIDMPKPTDTEYWASYKIPNGEFTWVNDIVFQHYPDISLERIGVPQGGALSGLIANIYLNQADIKMLGANVLYQRFCDDMIILSDNIDECIRAKDLYEKTLNELKLFPHPFKNEMELTSLINGGLNYKPFWEGKSKGPYKWGEIKNKCFPWIGFVGYEINYSSEIRVRKKSLKKELSKQKTIVKEIKNAIKVGMRKPKGTATESAINRLIGMSVGRVGLDNFTEVSTDLCWKNGFKELTINVHSIRQIKQLDRNRSKHYYKLLKEVEEPELTPREQEDRQVIKYNKPFSYYFQILERQKKANG